MKNKCLFILIFLLSFSQVFSQEKEAFKTGEWFKFRIHYGWFNASFATLEVKDDVFNNQAVHHVVGKGKSTGLLHLFFEVDDNYQTYIAKDSSLPLRFVRDINEGGHTKNKVIDFNQSKNLAKVHDKKHNTVKNFTVRKNVHDMLSVFYYLRNKIDENSIEKGDEILVDLFFDEENYQFKTVFLGREILKTKFGKVASLKFRPYVQAGRVFEEEESLTFWVSDDANKIPLKVEADLAVGSLEADLDAFKGLKHPFKIIMD
ncbi:DUF3108 domain-containing protein [Mesonia aquimarina]|uniref:DUF3108 domain-containing protein n=1 Tax=Mesonia aquimarina TaxID=1504967 RepID=UPI000EF5AC4F|nr:DUF3108 domain-containing protein [Mesonia aquimarina]